MHMSQDMIKTSLGPLAAGTLAVLCALAAPGAYADSADAFNVTLSYSLTHDDNLFRISSSDELDPLYKPKYDTVHVLGVRGSIDKFVSRQAFHADVSIQDSRYEEHHFLNNRPYNAGVAWLWQLGDNLSGVLKHTNTRNISSFENYQSVMKDVYRTRTDSASARYRFHPDWFVEGFVQRYSATHSLLATSDVDVRESRVAIITQRPSGDEIQVRAIYRHGTYPNQAGSVDYRYDERQVDALVTLVLSGSSSVTGSFGHLRRRNPQAPERDFSGQIGRLTWDWLPTGKLSLMASLERSLGAKQDISSTFALTDTLKLGATWAATDKVTVQLGADFWRSKFRGGDLPTWVPRREDNGRTLSAGASYQINRNLLAAVQWTYSRRDTAHSNFVAYYYGVVPYYPYASIPYRDNTVWFSLKYTFGFGTR